MNRFGHMTLTGMPFPDVISQVRVLKSASKNLAQVYRTNDCAISDTTDEEAHAIGSPTPLEKGVKLFALRWRRHQTPVQASACAVQSNELFTVAARRRPQQYPLADDGSILQLSFVT